MKFQWGYYLVITQEEVDEGTEAFNSVEIEIRGFLSEKGDIATAAVWDACDHEGTIWVRHFAKGIRRLGDFHGTMCTFSKVPPAFAVYPAKPASPCVCN